MNPRVECMCEKWPKPCAYHEGWLDAIAASEGVVMGQTGEYAVRVASEVERLAERVMTPTDWAVSETRECPDCGYTIGPGFQHGRQQQPEGASHVVCRLMRVLRWDRNDPPWPTQTGEAGETRECTRCQGAIPPWWRHFWPTCRGCAVWSVAGQSLMAAFGLNGHPWLYWGARPWCGDCSGTSYRQCEPQDLSIMRRSGACHECGAWSFVLFHATDQHGDIEGSARHYDGEADHEVIVGAAPLRRSLDEVFGRAMA